MLNLICPNGHSAEFEVIKLRVSLGDTSSIALEIDRHEAKQIVEIDGADDISIVYRCRTCQVSFEKPIGVFVYGQG